MVLTDDGRAFQARVAAAGKARSPSVDRRVGGTTSVGAAPDRICFYVYDIMDDTSAI